MSRPEMTVYILREPSTSVRERAELIEMLRRIAKPPLLKHFALAGPMDTNVANEMLCKWSNAVEENQKYGGYEYRIASSLDTPKRSDFDGAFVQTDRDVAWKLARNHADNNEHCPVQEISVDDLVNEPAKTAKEGD